MTLDMTLEEIFESTRHPKHKRVGCRLIFDPRSESEFEVVTHLEHFPQGNKDQNGITWVVQNTGEYISSLLDGLRGRLSDLSQEFNNKRPVHLYLTKNPEFDAFSFKKDNHEFIGISYGAIHLLKLVFNRIMSDRNLMKHVGNINLEEEKSNIWPDYRFIVRDNLWEAVAFPNDFTRGLYAQALTKIAIDFLVMHEFSHICNGHISWKHGKWGEEKAHMNDGIIEHKKTAFNKFSQAMEVDADSTAFIIGAVFKLMGRENILQSALQADIFKNQHDFLMALYGSDYNFLRSFFYAMNVLFRLQDFDSQKMLEKEKNIFDSTHPPFGLRAMSLVRFIDFYSGIGILKNIDRELLGQTLASSLSDAFESVSSITTTPKNWGTKFWGDKGEESLDNYAKLIAKAWGDMKPEILQLRRWG